MNQSELKKFAQNTRRKLIRQIDSRLDYVLNHDDPYLRAHGKDKKKIQELLDKKGKEQLVEETAYIWFNRLTALRFMDNRGYNRIRIVSPLEGESQPNILSEIKQGKFPEEIRGVRPSVSDYIDGKVETRDSDREAYKITLLAWCNYLGTAMPYLFEKIDDWAALLLPLDLLSEESIITDIQNGIQKDDC
ncbi:MAG: class I SAM-dependent DNA methyltransferase, partial [Spirochaetia bacterium]|nr:class I SAM-dependent DNA methyltransferase [Spirochaetia bacterium]